jgi:hypothetical protein
VYVLLENPLSKAEKSAAKEIRKFAKPVLILGKVKETDK